MCVIIIKLGIEVSLYKFLIIYCCIVQKPRRFSYDFKNFFLNAYFFFFLTSACNSWVQTVGWFHTSDRIHGLYINHEFRISPPKLFGVFRIPNEIYPLNQQKLATVIDIYSRPHLLSPVSSPENVNLYPASKALWLRHRTTIRYYCRVIEYSAHAVFSAVQPFHTRHPTYVD